MREKVKILEYKAHAQRNPAANSPTGIGSTAVRSCRDKRITTDRNLTVVYCFKLSNTAEQSAFAGAGRPDNRQHLAFFYGK